MPPPLAAALLLKRCDSSMCTSDRPLMHGTTLLRMATQDGARFQSQTGRVHFDGSCKVALHGVCQRQHPTLYYISRLKSSTLEMCTRGPPPLIVMRLRCNMTSDWPIIVTCANATEISAFRSMRPPAGVMIVCGANLYISLHLLLCGCQTQLRRSHDRYSSAQYELDVQRPCSELAVAPGRVRLKMKLA
eukprot:4460753-Prymnesium_polylepis.1